MTLNNIIDKAGDWNPQIFRELKERLTFRNMGIAALASLLMQGFVWFYYDSQIPTVIPGIKETYSHYCHKNNDGGYRSYSILCSIDPTGNPIIDWQLWWSDIFICLSWILPLGLILGSVYMLVADLVQEEKRGTLNFIRLSPQSARTIFMGKIFGVPSLVYLAAALILPLHLWTGINAGGNILLLAAWYATIGSMWFLLSSAAVLYVLLGGIQAILTIVVVAYPIGIPLFLINIFASATINQDEWLDKIDRVLLWFWLPVGGSAIWLYVFATGSCLVAAAWIWQAIERRYLNPTATAIGKSQSYLANLCVQVWLAGFALPWISQSFYAKEGSIIWLAVLDFMALLLLIPMLLPNKQSLQDWTRYRRERVSDRKQKFWQRELVQDLISNDKSPALLAIAINVGMAIILWATVSLLSFSSISHSVRFIGGLCLGGTLILIYATIAHLSLFLNVKKRNMWTMAIVMGVMFLPSVVALILSPNHSPTGIAAILLLFSPLAPMGILNLAGGAILATFVAQLAIFVGLTRQLQWKLQSIGQSQTKELLGN